MLYARELCAFMLVRFCPDPEVTARTAGRRYPEVTARTAGRRYPEVTVLTAGRRYPEVTARTAGRRYPEVTVLTAGRRYPEVTVLTAGRRPGADSRDETTGATTDGELRPQPPYSPHSLYLLPIKGKNCDRVPFPASTGPE